MRGATRVAALHVAPMPGDWAEHAACRGMAPTDGSSEHPFFPSRGERAPIEVCKRCPVVAYCRHYALRYPFTGMWGGMHEKQRRQWRRARRQAS